MKLLLWATLLLKPIAQPIASDTAENLRLTQYRQQHRRTEDGRLCAAAFVQNKQRFTDCTKTLAPDASTTGTEWCYVEAQYNTGEVIANSTPSWGFCRPVVDYDYIRTAATQSLKTRIEEVTRLSAKLASDKLKIDNVIERYDRVCNRELPEAETKVAEMEKLLQHGLHALSGAEEAADSITALDSSLEEMTAASEEDFIRALSQPENCRAVHGYEDEAEPDGLMGVYYPTPTFTCTGGQKQVRVDPVINFAWTARSPAPGIPYEAFSVRWDGYVQAPESGEYRLHLETACGGRVFLNRKLIIRDRMPDSPFVEAASVSNQDIPLLPPSGLAGVKKVSSNPLLLTGGQKVPIRIEMIHSAHLLWQDEDTSVIKLSWSSARIPEQPIASDFFFSSNPSPVLKLSRLHAAVMDVQYLAVGLEPFLNDKTTFVGDLPPELDNSKIIRMSKEHQANLVLSSENQVSAAPISTEPPNPGLLEFAINVPAQIFVAYLHNNPLEPSCGKSISFKRYGQDSMIGLYVYKGAGGRVGTRKASYVDYYKIDVATLGAPGGYRFIVKDSPWLVFLRALPTPNNGCDGGEVICLSDPTDSKSAFESCSVSSAAGAEFACEYGLNRLHRDERYTTWRSTSGRGVGEYMEITFRETVRPTSFVFKPLDDPLTWPSELTVYFEPGGSRTVEPQKFDLVYSSDLSLLRYTLLPTSTRYLRFEVSGMFATGQHTGGSIEVMGTICSNVEDANSNVALVKEVPSYAVDDCQALLSDLPQGPALRSGLAIDIDCPASCQQDLENYSSAARIYGTSVYSTDSSVCLAAIHAGVCSQDGPLDVCSITVLLVAGSQKYTGTDRNGIISGSHGPSDLSFVIQPRTQTAAEVNASPTATQQAAFLVIFNATDLQATSGDGSVLTDNGAPFDNKGQSMRYGWLHQATPVNCDTLSGPTGANLGDTEPLSGGVQFPPGSVTSALCNGTVDCSENYWSVHVEPGIKYDVVAQVGNPCKPEDDSEYRYDLSANGIPIVSNKKLKAQQAFFGTARNVKADEKGLIKLQSICTGSCDESLTTVLQVKIQQSRFP